MQLGLTMFWPMALPSGLLPLNSQEVHKTPKRCNSQLRAMDFEKKKKPWHVAQNSRILSIFPILFLPPFKILSSFTNFLDPYFSLAVRRWEEVRPDDRGWHSVSQSHSPEMVPLRELIVPKNTWLKSARKERNHKCFRFNLSQSHPFPP